MDIATLERHAAETLGPERFGFLSSGAGHGLTADDNVQAWRSIRLRPRVLVDVSRVDVSTTLLGTSVDLPIGIAPMGFQKVAHPDGEVGMAKGAAVAGAPLVVSTRTTSSFDDIAAALGDAPWWFQVYALRDRSITEGLVDRAIAAGCRALVVTADTPVVATKPEEASTGWHLDVPMANLDGLVVADAGRRDFEGLEQDPGVTEAFVREVAERGLPVVVKGILRADDAARAIAAGARGLIVSNHGGRQLDGAIATARALDDVVAAAGDDAEVFVDGGVRSGIDALKAFALGARAVFVGRPALWGLATAGAEGVARVMEGLGAELREAMMLAGAPSLADVTADLVVDG